VEELTERLNVASEHLASLGPAEPDPALDAALAERDAALTARAAVEAQKGKLARR